MFHLLTASFLCVYTSMPRDRKLSARTLALALPLAGMSSSPCCTGGWEYSVTRPAAAVLPALCPSRHTQENYLAGREHFLSHSTPYTTHTHTPHYRPASRASSSSSPAARPQRPHVGDQCNPHPYKPGGSSPRLHSPLQPCCGLVTEGVWR